MPQGERAFLYAAQEIEQEQEAKAASKNPDQTSGPPGSQAENFRKDVLEGR